MLSGEARPHRHRASERGSQLLDAVLVEPLARKPPDSNAPVWVDQSEPGLITEDDVGPLATVPVRKARGPLPASGQVGCCVLGMSGGDAGMKLDLMQAVSHGLIAHPDIGGNPKLPPDAIGCGGA